MSWQKAKGSEYACSPPFRPPRLSEVDGGQHAEDRQKDRERDKLLTEAGFKVLRFWNNEVFENLDGVLERIQETCLR